MATRSPRAIPNDISALESRLILSSSSSKLRRMLPQIEAVFSGLLLVLCFSPSTILIVPRFRFGRIRRDYPGILSHLFPALSDKLQSVGQVPATIAQRRGNCKGKDLRSDSNRCLAAGGVFEAV